MFWRFHHVKMGFFDVIRNGDGVLFRFHLTNNEWMSVDNVYKAYFRSGRKDVSDLDRELVVELGKKLDDRLFLHYLKWNFRLQGYEYLGEFV